MSDRALRPGALVAFRPDSPHHAEGLREGVVVATGVSAREYMEQALAKLVAWAGPGARVPRLREMLVAGCPGNRKVEPVPGPTGSAHNRPPWAVTIRSQI